MLTQFARRGFPDHIGRDIAAAHGGNSMTLSKGKDMAVTYRLLFAVSALSLALVACSGEPEAVAETEADMELAEDAADGTVADEMDSGPPDVQMGGGRAPGEADNPNEPVIPEDAEPSDTDPAEVR